MRVDAGTATQNQGPPSSTAKEPKLRELGSAIRPMNDSSDALRPSTAHKGLILLGCTVDLVSPPSIFFTTPQRPYNWPSF